MHPRPLRAAVIAVAGCGVLGALMTSAAAASTFVPQAAPHVWLSVRTGPPTTVVAVSGSGFGAHKAVDIYFDTLDEAVASTNSHGAFHRIIVTVPASAVPGRHWITAVQRLSADSAQASFLVSTAWAQDRYSASQNGLNPYENVLSASDVSQMGLRWSSAGDNETFSPAAVAGGKIYVGSAFDVYALSAATGAVKWSYSPGPGPTYFSAPAVAAGIVYVVSSDGTVYALSAATGALDWSYDTGDSASSSSASPTVANGIVYVGTNNDYGSGSVYALNAMTGALDWSYDSGPVTSSPAVADGVVYVYGSSIVYALNAATGSQEWISVITQLIDGSSPAVADGLIYIGDGLGQVYALSTAGAETEWERTLASPNEDSSPAVAGGTLYIRSGDNVYALNAATGATDWIYPTDGAIQSSPAVANGIVYIGSDDGSLYALNAATGERLWSFFTGDTGETSPAVANGMVYTGYRGLYAFGLPGGTAEGVPRPHPAALRPGPHVHLASS